MLTNGPALLGSQRAHGKSWFSSFFRKRIFFFATGLEFLQFQPKELCWEQMLQALTCLLSWYTSANTSILLASAHGPARGREPLSDGQGSCGAHRDPEEVKRDQGGCRGRVPTEIPSCFSITRQRLGHLQSSLGLPLIGQVTLSKILASHSCSGPPCAQAQCL